MSQRWRRKRQRRLRRHELGYGRQRVGVGGVLPVSRLTRGVLIAVLGLVVLSGTAVAAQVGSKANEGAAKKVAKRKAKHGRGAPGPALTTPASTLAASLSCPLGVKGKRDPVLFVPGGGGDPGLVFSPLYPVLRANRYPVCAVTMPLANFGDNQISAEYIVSSIRAMAARSGRPVSVIGVSQGGMQPRWALKWWPDVRSLVGDFIGLAPANQGFAGAPALCGGPCPPSTRQLIPGSQFLAALNGGDETPGRLSYSVISSATDMNEPPPLTELKGESDDSKTQVQEICPGREVDHGHIQFDAVAVALVLDALSHAGPARASRIPTATCSKTYADLIDPAEVERLGAAGLPYFIANYGVAGLSTTELALKDYATRPAPRPKATLRIHQRKLSGGRGTTVSFVARGKSGRDRWVLPGAEIKVAGRKTVTNRKGRASLRLQGSPSGSSRARLVAPGLAPVTARVTR
jgi:hypothetical protein